MPTPCFLLTPVAKVRFWLRRHANGPCSAVGGGEYSYHNAQTLLGDFDHPCPDFSRPRTTEDWRALGEQLRPPKEDPRWLRSCACGFQFPDSADWQMFARRLMQRSDTGELTTKEEAPPGALYWAYWLIHEDGHCHLWWDNQHTPPLICKTPGGEWIIDSRASNCDQKEERTHRCWVRHGEPPNIHVDKNGHTCGAGAGSIATHNGKYHGFLHNGALTD